VAASDLETRDGPAAPTRPAPLGERARAAVGDLDAAVQLARELGAELPVPGAGRTRDRWAALAALGEVDLTVARVVEPHLDALAILAESGHPDLTAAGEDGTSWGVYAAEGPAGRVRAHPAPGRDVRSVNAWKLDGTKPWCSLADVVDHALVTAWVDDDRRGLFAVPLGQPGVEVEPAAWASHGLSHVRSVPTSFRAADATLLGSPGWYLERDGFAWGGIGVAAVWYGGASAVAGRLRRQALERELDQVGWLHLGTVDAALHAAGSVLRESADEIDAGRADGRQGALLALRVRQVVADAVETTIRVADHALGPAPLAFEPDHATRISDLRVYLRQHHAERDTAALGRAALPAGISPW
jgi:alkylation response protein AidB-like acyl-CoA dehydrogenase